MSGTVEDYDGLCGTIATFARSDLQLKCKYDLNHESPHSWEKYRNQFQIFCGITREEVEARAKLDSPAAQAILKVSSNEK